MPEYKAPGVFIEEIERGPGPIDGVPTSTAAFLGETERGPTYPRLVTSSTEYSRSFGNTCLPDCFVPYAAAGFFENGGRRLYIARIVGAGATSAVRDMGAFTLQAIGPGGWGNRVWVRIVPSHDTNAISFGLRLAYWSEPNPPDFDPFEPVNRHRRPEPQHSEEFDGLSLDPQSPNFLAKRLTDPETNRSLSLLVTVSIATEAVPVPAPTAGAFLEGGVDGIVPVTVTDYIGAVDPIAGRHEPHGLTALGLDEFRDVSLVHAPFPAGDPSHAIAKRIAAHCEEHRFRFALIDSPNEDPTTLYPRDAIGATGYAAFYAPWIVVSDRTGTRVTVPPGGYIAGIYARVDLERGVHKAPANELVRGAIDLAFDVNDDLQSELNPRGVNTIRIFPSRGIRVWGARTLSSDNQWKYVSVRRLFIFLERSIYEGTQWVVFEPNDERLWPRVRDTIRLFLRTQWRAGALFGTREEDAFFIVCDRTTMTQDDIDNGRLICEIGIAPVRPAEFVIFRIFQQTLSSA
jgi:phage tail sheath protein FI